MKTVLSVLIPLAATCTIVAQEPPGSVIGPDLGLQNIGISSVSADALPIPTAPTLDEFGCQVINYHALPPCTCPFPNSGQIVTGNTFSVSPMQSHGGAWQVVPMPQPVLVQEVVTDSVQPVQSAKPQYYYSPQRPFRRGFRFGRFRR